MLLLDFHFFDLIPDPPSKLINEDYQKLRNEAMWADIILGIHNIPKAVGRVATNVKAPVSYSVGDILWDAYYPGTPWRDKKDINKILVSDIPRIVKNMAKAIITDKPTYKMTKGYEHREVPYRRMFNLKPRHSEEVFTPWDPKTRTIGFNPKNKSGQAFLDETMDKDKYHTIMGGYNRIPDPNSNLLYPQYNLKSGEDFEDVWDFTWNKGDFKKSIDKLKALSMSDIKARSKIKLSTVGGHTYNIPEDITKTEAALLALDEIASMGLRKFMDLVTDPVKIKGKVPKYKSGSIGTSDPNILKYSKLYEKSKIKKPTKLSK